MTDSLEIAITAGAVPAEWDAFVRAHPAAAWYDDTRWGAVMRAAYGLRFLVALVRRGGEVAGGVMLAACPRFPIGSRLVAGPFLASGGLLLREDVDRAAAEAALARELRRRGYRQVELRDRETGATVGPGDLVSMVLPLPDQAETLWSALDAKVRNQVRKAQKSGLSVIRGPEHARALWEVYSRHQWAHGTPTHGEAYFRAVVEGLPENSEVLLVRKDDAVVGGMLAYEDRGACVALNACSLREHHALCVNHLLYWEALALAIAQGAKVFDFGRSVFASGTYDFKKQWGAEPVRLRYHDLLGARVRAPVESENMKFAARVWSRLPLGLANALGPPLRRYLA